MGGEFDRERPRVNAEAWIDAGDEGPPAVIGASGYVGRTLSYRLAGAGHRVIAIGRNPDRLPCGDTIEQRVADVGDETATVAALEGVGAVYYLAHAMADAGHFMERDRASASSFARAARTASVRRIVFLGGLGDNSSDHLSSRHEVGSILAQSGIPVVELRAAVILGSGSISFEMLRYLTERLPVMVCPRWIDSQLQPLAEDDLMKYLMQAPSVAPGVYEVGSPEVTTYRQMIQSYAEVRGLRPRLIARVPFLSPGLSSRWVDLVTPVDRRVSHALIESLRSDVVVADPAPALATFGRQPLGVADAIRAALDDQFSEVTDALWDQPTGQHDGVHTMRTSVALPPRNAEAVRDDLARVGGDLRWYGVAWAWWLRLVLGRMFGEQLVVGRPTAIHPGVKVDWWTVAWVDDVSVVLVARWKLGDAWLAYRVGLPRRRRARHLARIEQIAAFRPRGAPGLLYWWLLWPIHWLVFRGMTWHRMRASGVASLGSPVA